MMTPEKLNSSQNHLFSKSSIHLLAKKMEQLVRKKLTTTKIRMFNFSCNFSKLDVWVCEPLKKSHNGAIYFQTTFELIWHLISPSEIKDEKH
uniref:Uncharacterized protein n=1 Tax=Strigamia maritima TaxID=126957 RepID=T1J8L4_STRMM